MSRLTNTKIEIHAGGKLKRVAVLCGLSEHWDWFVREVVPGNELFYNTELSRVSRMDDVRGKRFDSYMRYGRQSDATYEVLEYLQDRNINEFKG